MRKSLVILLGLAFASASQATTVLLFDDFDGYADQAAYAAAWPAATVGWPLSASTQPMLLDTAKGYSGTQSVHGVCTANGEFKSYRNFAPTEATADQPIAFSFMFELEGAGNRSYAEIRAFDDTYPAGGLQRLLALGVNNAPEPLTQYSFRTYGGGGDAWQQGTVARQEGWVELKAMIYPDKVDYFVDDVLAHSSPQDNVGIQWNNVMLGSGITSAGLDAWYDDVSVVQIPEPATLAFLALGGLFLVRRRV